MQIHSLLRSLEAHRVSVLRFARNCTWTGSTRDLDPSVLWELTQYDTVVVVAAGTVINRPIRHLACSSLPFAVFVDLDAPTCPPSPSTVLSGTRTRDDRGGSVQSSCPGEPLSPTPLMVLRPSATTAAGLRWTWLSPSLTDESSRAAVGLVHDPKSHTASLLEFYFFASSTATEFDAAHAARRGTVVSQDSVVGRGVYVPLCAVRKHSRFCTHKEHIFTLRRDDENRDRVRDAGSARQSEEGRLWTKPVSALTGTISEPTSDGDVQRPQLVFLHVPRSGGRSVECTFGEYKFSRNPMFRRAQQEVHGGSRPPIALCCGGHAHLAVLEHRFGPPTPRLMYVFSPLVLSLFLSCGERKPSSFTL